MGDTDKPGDGAANTNRHGKRDREHGMFHDPLVSAQTKEREREMDKPLNSMRKKGRLADVYSFVSKYRPGTPIGVRPPLRGRYNVIFVVDFTDGSALLRVAVPGAVAYSDEKVRAEVATMLYVEKMTSIPVPHIYHWGTVADNPLGMGAFIIMDYIPHHQSLAQLLAEPTVKDDNLACLKDDNRACFKDDNRACLDPKVPRETLARMYRQVAGILLQLSKLEMPRIGTLQQDASGSFSVITRPMTEEMNDLLIHSGTPWSVLPDYHTTYETSDEWYAALADVHVAHLTFQHNRAVESADDCRDKFVARHLVRQRARAGGNFGTARRQRKSTKKKEKFRLWIDGFRPQNILVDADLNIVGVIDWEWAYFAPESYVQDPPWWLLLGRPEHWRGTVLEFRDEFVKSLDVFIKELRAAEEEHLASDAAGTAAARTGEGQNDRPINQQLRSLNLEADATIRLSDRMRQNWDSGLFWANYAARNRDGFDPVFWEFLDERFFGENVEGGYEGRMHLLSEKVKWRMERFVERKMEETKESKIVEWDADEAKSDLAEILADLDK